MKRLTEKEKKRWISQFIFYEFLKENKIYPNLTVTGWNKLGIIYKRQSDSEEEIWSWPNNLIKDYLLSKEYD